jgi:hypothetical protein
MTLTRKGRRNNSKDDFSPAGREWFPSASSLPSMGKGQRDHSLITWFQQIYLFNNLPHVQKVANSLRASIGRSLTISKVTTELVQGKTCSDRLATGHQTTWNLEIEGHHPLTVDQEASSLFR